MCHWRGAHSAAHRSHGPAWQRACLGALVSPALHAPRPRAPASPHLPLCFTLCDAFCCTWQMTLIVAMASISFSVSAAQSFGVPQLPRFFSTASMGHNPGQKVDYYSAGQEYFTDDDFDFPKLERDVLNSRLKMYSTRPRPEFEKQQARRPRCAHCAPSFARSSQLCARPSSAHIGPALRAPVF